MGDTNQAVQFNSGNLWGSLNIVEGILGRFLAFASFELPRLIGHDTATRLTFMKQNLWLSPIVVFLTLVGILQCIAMLVLWFRKQHSQPDWGGDQILCAGDGRPVVRLFFVFDEAAVVPQFLCRLPGCDVV